jgi:transcriptional regulator with XRE-family HTH domain
LITNIGQRIRLLRKKCGYSIQNFAQKLDVSVGYLSNLETGKSETIQLSLLQQLHHEFGLFDSETIQKLDNDEDFEIRLLHANHLLRTLHTNNKEQSDYLLSLVEKGADLFNKEK